MDPQQIALVKISFAEATAKPEVLARAFYDRLFEAAPGLTALFTSDRSEQQRKLTLELKEIVGLLDHVDHLVARTSELGSRHVEYGARAGHYDVVGAAILGALSEVLGERFTTDAAAAWRFAYNLVAEAMQQGADAATTGRRGAL